MISSSLQVPSLLDRYSSSSSASSRSSHGSSIFDNNSGQGGSDLLESCTSDSDSEPSLKSSSSPQIASFARVQARLSTDTSEVSIPKLSDVLVLRFMTSKRQEECGYESGREDFLSKSALARRKSPTKKRCDEGLGLGLHFDIQSRIIVETPKKPALRPQITELPGSPSPIIPLPSPLLGQPVKQTTDVLDSPLGGRSLDRGSIETRVLSRYVNNM